MLEVYARQFNATELNYTWYQMPKAPAMERMCRRIPPGFRFAAKLVRTLTHEISRSTWQKEALLYRQGIAPLIESKRLMCILIQLPPGFHRSPENRSYLAALLDELSGLPLAVEFRHRSWAADKVFAELERRNIALVCVDIPSLPDLFPPLARVTSPDLFYIRLHGRNAKGWHSGSMQHQFDYHYNDSELEQWAEIISEKLAPSAASGAVFFNNHVRAQAPGNALTMMQALKDRNLYRPDAGEAAGWNGPSSI